ncbi:MAG TPA: hypothetical protein VFG19_17160 [Geobacteraceae bacterium]|nr:hypothetical protein [Geobacteraceae bacterium]
MKENETEKELLRRIRECLDKDLEIHDLRTVRALRSSRLEALDLFEKKRARGTIQRWITAGGIATVVVLVVAVSLFHFSPQKSLPLKNADDLEMLNVTEHPEMYRDLDFYRWLAERNDAG